MRESVLSPALSLSLSLSLRLALTRPLPQMMSLFHKEPVMRVQKWKAHCMGILRELVGPVDADPNAPASDTQNNMFNEF